MTRTSARDSHQPQAISPFTRFAAMPEQAGLYRPESEKDACGLAVVATLRGTPGHDIVQKALDCPAQPGTPRCRWC